MRHQLDIIHDDEALKMGQQTIVLVGSYLELKLVFFAPNRQVALNPALRVEDHVPCAGPRDQIRNVVRHHPAQPTKAIFAVHGYSPHPTKIMGCGSLSLCRYFRC
jgi:hypothetical protein